MRLRACVSAIALLSACAGPTGTVLVAKGQRDLDEAKVCCAVMADALRVKLPVEKTRVLIDKSAQAFMFSGKKAFFMLYELPVFTTPYSITVTSVSEGRVADVALLVPRLALYDAEFKPTRFFDEKTLRNRGDGLERTVFINPTNTNERFLSIFGSDLSASVERSYSVVTVTPIMAGPVFFNMVSGQDGKSVLRSSPVGVLELEVVGLSVPPGTR